MRQFSMLVLTDHSNHTSENALYPMVQALRNHPRCDHIDVATRANALNNPFFERHIPAGLFVQTVDEGFRYHPDGSQFRKQHKQRLRGYDVVWLRLPPPLSSDFLHFLKREYPNTLFINDPIGIWETGSKAFLLNFPDLCPSHRLCQNLSDITEFKNEFPIVLKPLREYGGRGIIRIDGDQVWEGNKKMSFAKFSENYLMHETSYLGVKFLKNVTKGDKRIVVVNGKVMGASLRLPPKNSWICNVSMGGSSHQSDVDREEQKIVDQLSSELLKKGILIYGLDTLEDDDGNRVLSEINTTSIGGLPAIEREDGKPVIKTACNLIWQFITEKLVDKHVV